MEHRWGMRHAVNWPVLLGVDRRSVTGKMLNVSLSGAYVKTPLRLPAPALLRLSVNPASDFAWHLEEPVLVVRRDGEGLAIEWQEDVAPAWLDALRAALLTPRGLRGSAPAPRARLPYEVVPALHLPHAAAGSERSAAIGAWRPDA